jgi:predicted nucleic acid-binding protein
LRIVTHPRVFRQPDQPDAALTFCEALLGAPNSVIIQPGERHWPIFADICRRTGARGPLVPGAWFAALAIEWHCEWISLDRDFARFPGLRWRLLRA